jgi:hypothetical protein
VRVVSRGVTIEANDMVYDPVDEVLIARGSENVPVTVTDQQGRDNAAFSEIWWDTKSGRIIKMLDVQGGKE